MKSSSRRVSKSLALNSETLPGRIRTFVGPASLVVACAMVLARQTGNAATIYWDGSGTGWDSVGSWSQLDTVATPDPVAVPGSADIATFVATTATAAQTVNLNADQSALGLATTAANTFLTTIRGGGASRTLNLGASGINHIGGGLTIGSTTAGQEVAISLQGAQSWISSSAGTGSAGLVVSNGVSIGAGGNQVLTLAGTNTIARINGIVSDGAGVLGIGKTGAGTWFLAAANTYTGVTTVSGGSLRIENNQALGSTTGGTAVGAASALQLANNITVTGEALSLLGEGITANQGALRNISGTNTWAGDVTIQAAAITRVASDAGLLRISGNVFLSPNATDQFVLQGNGSGEISGVISGTSRVTRSATGTGVWTLSGANTYTGKTTVTNGVLAASSLNSVVGGVASSSLGAPTTVANGTIDLGGTTNTGALRYIGSGETTDRVINLPGSTGGGVIDQSGTGLLKFTSNTTAAAGSKTLTLQGSTAGTGEFGGVIGGAALSVTKAGTGTWSLSGANSYSGGTNVNAGTLIANLSANPAGVLPATTALAFGGGRLNVLGAGSGTSTQTVASLSLGSGQSTVAINPNGGASTTLTITSPTVTATVGSRLLFDYTQGTTNGAAIGNNVVAWNATLTNGLIGPAYFVSDAGGYGFATVSGGNVVRLIPSLGLPQSGASATENYLVNTNTSSSTPGSLNLTQTASQSINTLTVDTAATSGTVSLGSTVLSTNAILLTGSSANTFAISGSGTGGVRAAAADASLLLEHRATGAFTISAPILENGLGGLVNSANGTTVLSGANTYTGATILNSGTTRFAGSMAAGTITINSGAIAQFGAANGLSTANSVLFGPASTGRLQMNGVSGAIRTLSLDAVPGTPIVENANATPGTLTLAPIVNATYSVQFRNGAGGGALGLTFTASDPAATITVSGTEANTHTGVTTIDGVGLVDFNKVGVNAVGGDVAITNGGRLRFAQSNQIADTATVTISGSTSNFNGTALNTGTFALNETFANLTITGGGFATGTGATGYIITGATSITGGADNTIFLGNSGSMFSTGSLSLTDMTATAGGTVATSNSFTIYGASTTVRSRLTVGAGGLTLNGSVLNMRRGGAGSMGSQLVLNGDVTTAGFAPSRINLDTAGGSTGALSLDLSSTPGDVNRNFNIAGGGADLTVGIPIVNGAATTASITKSGPGTLTLSAVNTYNGSTNIKEGTVVVSGTASGGAAIVGNSAIPATPAILMGGNGAVSATPTLSDISAITAGARIDPGISSFSAGVLNTNTFSLTSSSRLTIQIGGTTVGGNGIDGYDRINVLSSTTSAVVSGGFLDLADMSLSVLPSDSLLFILVNNGSGPSSAPFGGVTLDGSPVANLNNIVIGGQPFALVYNAHFDGVSGSYGGVATGGNDIALVAVPEPLSAATLFGSIALLALRRSRRD